MKNYLIAPSILSADFANLGQDTQKVLDAGADMIHFDVMDNHFVPNLTMGPMFCQALRNYGINAPIDVHLMVSRTEELIIAFAKSGANHISIHPESTLHLDRTLQLIRDQGCTAGIVLNPATPLGHLDYIMDKVDLILLMSVNPGFGGQAFIPSTIEKLKAVKQRINHSGFDIRLQVDGGVKVDNIADIAKAGADIFVAGSAIFDQPDYHSVINAMREQLSRVDIL